MDPRQQAYRILVEQQTKWRYLLDSGRWIGRSAKRLADSRTEEGGAGTLPSSFSPDGKRLALYNVGRRGFAADIFTLSIEGDADHPHIGKTEAFLSASGFSVQAFAAPEISPDGHWMAFALGESGRSEVYVQPFPGPGGKLQISNGGGMFPRWSRNGRELA